MPSFVRSAAGRPAETRRRVAETVFADPDDRRGWLESTLLRPAQVAALLHVSRRSVAEWARTGRLPSIATPGGHRRFRAADVRALVDALTVTPHDSGAPR